MKIVQLCPYAMTRPGGVQTHIRDLTDWLVQEGHEVRIIAPPAAGSNAQRKGAVIELGKSKHVGIHGTGFEISRAKRRNLRGIADEMRDWGAELIHAHTPWTPFLVGQMIKALNLPVITTIHATLPDPKAGGVIERYIRWSAKRLVGRSHSIIVPSEAPLPMLRALQPSLRAHVLPPAIDLSPWDNPTARKRPYSFFFFGRLERRKGVDMLLRAWPHIAAALPEAQLTMVGDGPLRKAVEGASQPGLQYLPSMPHADLVAKMQESEIFLAPAPYGESYGLVLAEAMAAGAIPVATDNAGYASVLKDRNVLLCVSGSAKALADKAIAVAQDREVIPRHRQWAVTQSKASDVKTVGPKYTALYQSCLSRDG